MMTQVYPDTSTDAKTPTRPAIPENLAALIDAAGAEYQRRPRRVDAIYARVRRVIATSYGCRTFRWMSRHIEG